MVIRFLLLVLVLGLLSGCSEDAPRDTDGAAITVNQAMGGDVAEGFQQALKPRPFDFPRDHGPHRDFATEWWYFTGNLVGDGGRRFGYQLTLFRIGLSADDLKQSANNSPWRSPQMYMGHLAVTDITGQSHHSRERFARAANGLAGAQSPPLKVWLDHWTISGAGQDKTFPITLHAEESGLAIELTLAAGDKPRVLQGEAGLSPKGYKPGNASYYYSHTRLPTEGSVVIAGERFAVSGHSWFDREWSSSALEADQAGWDWFALQFDDGRELMIYRLRTLDGRQHGLSAGVLVDQQGKVRKISADQFQLIPGRTWQSPAGEAYPVQWRIVIAEEGIELAVEAAVDDQWMDHAVSYWEGAVTVNGTEAGRGYLEMSGYPGRNP